jgi:hypothetical protein
MNSQTQEAAPDPAPHPPGPAPMTACACTGRTFEDVAVRVLRDGLTAAEAEGLTGCGSICTACIPDLRSYLGRLPRPVPSAPKESVR